MRLFTRCLVAAAIASGFGLSANAQGPGGFGGGMFGGGQMVYGMVAQNKALQDELKITDDQKTKLTEALKPLNEKRREMMQGIRDMSDDERKEMQTKLTKLGEETKKAVEGALNADQTKRLTQISYQVMGVTAFTNKDVVTALKLSDDQKEKFKGIIEEYNKDAADLRRDMPRGRGADQSEEDAKKAADARKKMTALRTEAEEKIVSALSADQKTAWKALTGEKFDVTKLQQGAPGGNRPMRRDS